MEWRYRDWGVTHEAILKPSSEAQNSFWIKNRTGEDMGNFSAGLQLIKLSRVLQVIWQEYVNGDGRHLNILIATQKSVRTNGVCAVLNSWDIFENVSTTKLPWLKAAQFSQFCAHCTCQQCFHENCLQMLEKELWPPNNSSNLNEMEISWLGSDARSYFETFIRSPE